MTELVGVPPKPGTMCPYGWAAIVNPQRGEVAWMQAPCTREMCSAWVKTGDKTGMCFFTADKPKPHVTAASA